MGLTNKEYADLAADAYEDRKLGDEDIVLTGTKYKIIDHAHNKLNGYQGTVYQRVDTGEIVVAHRGTEPDHWIQDGVIVDGAMVLARTNLQADDAVELTNRALAFAEASAHDYKGHTPEVTVTGHSLGGCLAQIAAYKLDLKGETFNAYGAASLDQRLAKDGSMVTNHVMATDPVSAASPHYGRMLIYAAPKEIGDLQRAGYDNTRNLLQPRDLVLAAANSLAFHPMHQFLNVDDKGSPDRAIFDDPQALQRAEQFDPAIDRFRGDIAFARTLLTVSTRSPIGKVQDVVSALHGPEQPGERIRRQERSDAALTWEESRGIADTDRPLQHSEPPYRPALTEPGGPLPMPEYFPQQGDHQRPPLKSGDERRSDGIPLSAIPSGHPDHALYTELKQQLPSGTSEDRLAQITVAVKLGGVTAGHVQGVHINDQSMQLFVAGTVPGHRCSVDLSTPPPSPQETLQQSEVFDRQQTQQLAQFQAQQQSINAQTKSSPSVGFS